MVRSCSALDQPQQLAANVKEADLPGPVAYPCAGLTIDYITQSTRLRGDRQELLILGFKHLVREGYVTKAHLTSPEKFEWDNERFGNTNQSAPNFATMS